MTEIYADGQLWMDADGQTEWSASEAAALAEVLAKQGYRVRQAVVRESLASMRERAAEELAAEFGNDVSEWLL